MIEALYKAIDAEDRAEIKTEVGDLHISLGLILKGAGRYNDAKKQLELAVQKYRAATQQKEYMNSFKVHFRLADALAELGNLGEASKALAKAVAIEPLDPTARMRLVQLLEYSGRVDEAVKVLEEGIAVMTKNNQDEVARKFNGYLARLRAGRN